MHHFGTKKTCIIAGLNNMDMARVDPGPHKIWRSRCYLLNTPGLHERRSFAVHSGTTFLTGHCVVLGNLWKTNRLCRCLNQVENLLELEAYYACPYMMYVQYP